MSFRLSRVRARFTCVLLVAAVHVLAFLAILQIHVAPVQEVEGFTTVAFFLPAAPHAPATQVFAAPGIRRSVPGPTVQVPSEPEGQSTAITLPSHVATQPAAVSSKIDWYGQLEAAAAATLASDERHERQLGALVRPYQPEHDPGNPSATDLKDFRWYDAGVHRIDTRGPVPVLHLGDRCVLIAFVVPVCAIGHIETYGDLFDNAARVHDERLATAGPNTVP
jgi:hypothetical protein